jgi:DNA-binding FrmR family transcriptional regulator
MEDCEKVIIQMNRIRGQVEGISKMILEKRDYSEIIIQILAVKSSLDRVGKEILKQNSKKCFDKKTEVERLKEFESIVNNLFKLS